ncbi:MAG TPA: DUF222 domain-containing protein, partial [Ornithinibacter sp.]|nr:DUF222 domain-containing protein [Ornithinibacter sp.]
MTTTIPRPQATPDVVSQGVARVHAAIDELGPCQVDQVTGRDVAEVDRAIARLEAVKLRMVAAADRRGAGEASGMSGTSAWLAAHTRSWGAKAAADVSLATALESSLPATKEALAAGTVSTAHAAIIAGAASRLPDSLTDAERAKVETALVAQAKRVDPARLRRAARRALLAADRSAEEARAHEDAELRGEESRAEARVRLTLHDNHDGTVTGHFTVPTLAGSILRKVIQQMVSPRRQSSSMGDADRTDGACASDRGGAAASGSGSRGADVGRPESDGSDAAVLGSGALHAEDSGLLRSGGAGSGRRPTPGSRRVEGTRDWAHEYGSAFVELLEHLPTDRLSGKVAATVVVTIDHDHLRES